MRRESAKYTSCFVLIFNHFISKQGNKAPKLQEVTERKGIHEKENNIKERKQ